jgi:SAM-dependent methyltransferase
LALPDVAAGDDDRKGELVRVVDAESLTRNNLMYREPALHDELLADESTPADLLALIKQHRPDAKTVLDLGCGTGRLLARLHRQGITGSGIDLQPSLIHWAQCTHPGLRLSLGDLCTIRLGGTFDLVTCVGNTLSYLHSEADLAAAFDTIQAHSHPGALLAIATLTGTGRYTHGHHEITTSLGTATVTTTSEWDPTTQILTTTRSWRFDTGRVEHDTMRRRCWSTEQLSELAHTAGFDIVTPTPPSLCLCAVRRQPAR